MKNKITHVALLTSFLGFGLSLQANIIATDDFNYSNGSLVGNGSWASHSGTAGDFVVNSGQAVVQHGAPSEDVNLPFSSVSGSIYFALDFSIDDLGHPFTGTDNEYFTHFKDDGSTYRARVDVVQPSSTGDYSIGISSTASTAESTWATDLSYGSTYRMVVKYDQDENLAQLWIDPVSDLSTSILGADESNPGTSITQFAFRQSDSSENETIRVDNLIIATTFSEALGTAAVPEPSTYALILGAFAFGLLSIRRRFNK